MRSLCVSMGVLALASVSQAGVIYDNGSPPDNGELSTYLAETGAPGFAEEVADDFILASGMSTIRDIHWWGGYFNPIGPGLVDDFTITIYNDAAVAPIPGTVNTVAHAVSVVRTPVTIGEFDLYFYTALVDEIALAPDTRYWLGLSNNSGFGWGWAAGDGMGVLQQSLDTGSGQWISGSDSAAFYLTDDVPAPGGLALVGVAGVLGARRRR